MIVVDNNTLNIAVIGGDERQKLIYRYLHNRDFSIILEGHEDGINYNRISKSKFIILPTVVSRDGDTLSAPNCKAKIPLNSLLAAFENCQYIACGNIKQELANEIESKKIKLFKYTDCPVFKTLNAVPTAEGAIAIAIEKTDKTICGSKCLIIGNGSIGKCLSKSLKGLGAKVTVSARKEIDFANLWSDNIAHINTNNLNDFQLSEYDIIFNTVPKRIITNDSIKKLDKDTLIIDLASNPYGFDHSINDIACRLILAPSLPAIYAPKSSATATAKTIENYISEVINNA